MDILEVLEYAKSQPKGDWSAYSATIRRLDDAGVPDELRDDVQREIVKILEV